MIVRTYLEKQHDHYRQAQLLGQRESALDALWRAASHSDMLTPDEHSHTRLSPIRVNELLTRLGWAPDDPVAGDSPGEDTNPGHYPTLSNFSKIY